MQVRPDFEGFDWDAGNRDKDWRTHNVAWWECEELFFNQPLFIPPGPQTFRRGASFLRAGNHEPGTPAPRRLHARKKRLRVISAREMIKRERRFFREKLKKIPKLEGEDAVREFWASADSTEYLDWSKAKPAFFPNLKPSSRMISIRLPESLLEGIKVLANRRDVPYQSMLKILLAEKVQESFSARKRKGKAA